MPQLTDIELKHLDRLSNRIYDVLFQELDLSEGNADRITNAVMSLIKDMAAGKKDDGDSGFYHRRRY